MANCLPEALASETLAQVGLVFDMRFAVEIPFPGLLGRDAIETLVRVGRRKCDRRVGESSAKVFPTTRSQILADLQLVRRGPARNYQRDHSAAV